MQCFNLKKSQTNTWPTQPPNWTEVFKKILDVKEKNKSAEMDLSTFNELSEKFQKTKLPFLIKTITCKELVKYVDGNILKRNIHSVYPVLHETALQLFVQFLAHKNKFGSEIERKLYKDMPLTDFVDRLLKKKAAMFVGAHDHYLLLNGIEGFGEWETIGKTEKNLKMEDNLSYDEIKLSVLISISSYTYFVNNGKRQNNGVYDENRNDIQDEGIIISLVGPRLHRPMAMEHQDIIVSEEQNHQGNGYGNTFVPTLQGMFLNFYEEPSLTYSQLKSSFKNKEHFTNLGNGTYFNNFVYKKRNALSIDTLLIEANDRARIAGTYAYVQVVGIGLGVWKVSHHQTQLFMDTFGERLKFLGEHLKNISDICFAYINVKSCGNYKDGDIFPIKNHPLGGIKIYICKREPHTRLAPYKKDVNSEEINKLLVVSYAGDGNALPGNEFWTGCLNHSSDSAAASSTQIVELHNAHINPLVCGDNLRIATFNGLVSISEYLNNRD